MFGRMRTDLSCFTLSGTMDEESGLSRQMSRVERSKKAGMNSEKSTRTWNDFFQTMSLLLLINLANICWQSINPILKTVGLIIPLAALLTLFITFIIRRKKVCIPFFFIPLALFLPLQILLIPHTPVPAASKRCVPVLINTMVVFILIYNLLRRK